MISTPSIRTPTFPIFLTSSLDVVNFFNGIFLRILLEDNSLFSCLSRVNVCVPPSWFGMNLTGLPILKYSDDLDRYNSISFDFITLT